MNTRPPDRAGSRGQILVIFVGGFLALLAGTALVVDGGNIMAQQRATQNGVDAAAQAGTVVIAQRLVGGTAPALTGACPTGTVDPWDLDVCRAVHAAAAANQVEVDTAEYTDYAGSPVGSVGGGSVPTGAQGVRAFASRQFDTYFARAIGLSTFTATTQATAVTGIVTSLCPPGSGCGVFPITVPVLTSTCDGSGTLVPGSDQWPYLGDAQTTPANEAIVPICKNKDNDIGGGSAGSVGWLDLSTALGGDTDGSCHNQFKNAIIDPCAVSIPFPTWIQTWTGGDAKGGPDVQDALNAYHLDTVQIPLFDGTCKVQPSGTSLQDCPNGEIGVGSNTWYHIPTFANFKLDYAYLAGNDRKECDRLPGSPFVGGNGSNGCIKGWWVYALVSPGGINIGPISQGTTDPVGVQLIK